MMKARCKRLLERLGHFQAMLLLTVMFVVVLTPYALLLRLFGSAARHPEAPLEQRHMDLAASIQRATEILMLELADPRRADMQRTLNQKIEFREGFRPFVPVVLEERAAEVFDLYVPSPYMLLVS